MLKPIIATPLRRIPTLHGDVLHGMKASDPGFDGFGEAYFSIVKENEIKGWKRHKLMVLNFICPLGAVRVVAHDGITKESWFEIILSPNSTQLYQRLTIPALYWVAFQGTGKGESMILNVASLEHDPNESENVALSSFPWPAA